MSAPPSATCFPEASVRLPLAVQTDAEVIPSCSASLPQDGPCPVCPHLIAKFEPYRKAAYWEAMHKKAKQRIADLEQQNADLLAKIRLREQQLFGTKTEATTTPSEATTPAQPAPKKPRGQQRGKPSPPRRDHSHLPAVEDIRDLPADQKACTGCGNPFAPFPGTEDSEVLEIEVKAYRRVIRRKRYRPTCSCGKHPGIITVAPAEKVIPKSTLGVSLWAEILLDKYLFYRPTYRLLESWKGLGLDLSQGTITDGLQRLLPLFEPVYLALIQHNQQQVHWHADETRWSVFATLEGKVGYRWWLWVFHSEQTAVFVLSSGRAHDVPEGHLGPVQEGILSVDRYSAYKAMKQVKEGLILLAFCWAHVRRDFLGMARSWPTEESWTLGWVERIGQLYQANDARLEALEQGPEEFAALDDRLRQQVSGMATAAEQELQDPALHPAKRRVLTSLSEHWDGLTVFVDFPEVPMDNNAAERRVRGPVVGRKNYYGSGAVWAGELAAMLFSVFATLSLWNINPRLWLTAYLQSCASAGGKAPVCLDDFLPWKLSSEKLAEWSLEKEKENSS